MVGDENRSEIIQVGERRFLFTDKAAPQSLEEKSSLSREDAADFERRRRHP
jgi:hypothetical protein